MNFTTELLDELNILALFNLSTLQEGIKVHQHSAPADTVAATERLFHKGLITQLDGGYLTSMGLEAAQQAQLLLGLLNPAP